MYPCSSLMIIHCRHVYSSPLWSGCVSSHSLHFYQVTKAD